MFCLFGVEGVKGTVEVTRIMFCDLLLAVKNLSFIMRYLDLPKRLEIPKNNREILIGTLAKTFID